MTEANVFAEAAHGEHSPEVNYVRTREFFDRLRGIHPLFATISPRGTRSGYKHMLAQPSFPGMTFEEWLAAYAAHKKPAERAGGSYELGVDVPYWNRRKGDDYQTIKIDYDVTYELYENDLMLTRLARELIEPDVTLAILRACIEAFDCPRAESAWYTSDPDQNALHFRYHRLWLRADQSFPKGKPPLVPGQPPPHLKSDRYKQGHPPPPVSEPWLDGTLYTWPEHDPRLLEAATAAA